jgi:hypothetical protein
MRTAPLVERFWAKVERRGPDECWPWLGGKARRGYGMIRADGRQRPASRVAWSIAHNAPFPPDKFACHTCDNPSCVNPTHIWPGTPGDNMRDMVAKGRSPDQRKPHCAQGHAFTPENTYVSKRGRRQCRECTCARVRADYHKNKAGIRMNAKRLETIAYRGRVG